MGVGRVAKGVNESIAKLLLVDKKYKIATAWFAAVAVMNRRRMA